MTVGYASCASWSRSSFSLFFLSWFTWLLAIMRIFRTSSPPYRKICEQKAAVKLIRARLEYASLFCWLSMSACDRFSARTQYHCPFVFWPTRVFDVCGLPEPRQRALAPARNCLPMWFENYIVRMNYRYWGLNESAGVHMNAILQDPKEKKKRRKEKKRKNKKKPRDFRNAASFGRRFLLPDVRPSGWWILTHDVDDLSHTSQLKTTVRYCRRVPGHRSEVLL